MLDDLLIEIQSEELPPKALLDIRNSFVTLIADGLHNAALSFETIKGYASPRRIAVLAHKVQSQQRDQTIERRGPPCDQAYDKEGKPTQACLGFLKSINATPDDISILKTAKGEWVVCKIEKKGQTISALLPEILENAVKRLPIPKRMRWGNHNYEYARPAHGLVVMYGNHVIDTSLFGLKANNKTCGHRIHHPDPVTIETASDYPYTLEKAFVIADFDERKQRIREQTLKINIDTLLDDELLEEVTNIAEWPTSLLANFDKSFLEVPNEVLVTSMKEHQKSFSIIDENGKMEPQFIFVANLESKQADEVIRGNERVMSARLSDAKFFYDNDLKTPLADHLEKLKTIIFQKGLGTLFDKTERLKALCFSVAKFLNEPEKTAVRAAELSKCDLMTEMVYEFPELQGIMGYYYALKNNESLDVATAIKEQYLPKFSGDNVPSSKAGIILSISEKMDSLVGLFGINKMPTGTKDPFALRRAALGLLRTLVENKISINLKTLIELSAKQFDGLKNPDVTTPLCDFFWDRLYVYMKEKGYAYDCFDAVKAIETNDPYDMTLRIEAVAEFESQPEAAALSEANKRVANILKKASSTKETSINKNLFEHVEETSLHDMILKKENEKHNSYLENLISLVEMQPVLDKFFENVLVNADDESVRNNRLALLSKLRTLFLNVADIAALQ